MNSIYKLLYDLAVKMIGKLGRNCTKLRQNKGMINFGWAGWKDERIRM